MLEFREVALSDCEWVTECMRKTGLRGSEYTFANLYNWALIYNIKIAKLDDFLIVRNGFEEYGYLYPVGSGDVKSAIDEIIIEAKS